MHLDRYVGKLVFFRLHDKRMAEAFGLNSDMLLSKVQAVDDSGIWIEWRYPLTNNNTGEQKLFTGELLIPHQNIAAAFSSDEFQRDVEMQAEMQRFASGPPAGVG
jgi:hypothetical protein